MKEIMNKLDFVKVELSCSTKDAVKRIRQATADYEKILANDTSAQGLLFKIYKEVLKVNERDEQPN